MNTSKNQILFVVICVLTAVTWGNSSQASPIASGNSFIPVLKFASSDEIGYAAYSKDGTSSDPWNTGFNNLADIFSLGTVDPVNSVHSVVLDTNAQYLYLYQIINSTSGPSITSVSIPVLSFSQNVTSYGAFAIPSGNSYTGATFKDSLGGVFVESPPLISSAPGLGVPFLYPTLSLTNILLTASISLPPFNIDDTVSYIFGFTSNIAPSSASFPGISANTTVQLTSFTDSAGILHEASEVVAPGVVSINPVPEPEILTLILLGLLGITFKTLKFLGRSDGGRWSKSRTA